MAKLDEHIHRINPLDLEVDIAIGIGLPMSGDKFGTFNLNYTSKEQIISNLKNLILTMKGERVMEPEFGTNIYRLMFETADTVTLNKRIRLDITSSIKRWMPGVQISAVDTTMLDHTMNISISFVVPNFNISDTFSMEINRA